MRLKDCAARKSMEARLLLVVWRGGMCQSNGQSREAGRVSSSSGSEVEPVTRCLMKRMLF